MSPLQRNAAVDQETEFSLGGSPENQKEQPGLCPSQHQRGRVPAALAADSARAAAGETKPGAKPARGPLAWPFALSGECSDAGLVPEAEATAATLGHRRRYSPRPPPNRSRGEPPSKNYTDKNLGERVHKEKEKCRVTGKSARTRSHLKSDNRIPLPTRGNSPGKLARAPGATLPSHGRNHLRGARPGLNSGLRDAPPAPLTWRSPGTGA